VRRAFETSATLANAPPKAARYTALWIKACPAIRLKPWAMPASINSAALRYAGPLRHHQACGKQCERVRAMTMRALRLQVLLPAQPPRRARLSSRVPAIASRPKATGATAPA
jgi:hypothetical protein